MRYYSSQAVETSLIGSITDTATSMTVAAITGYPTSTPFTVVLEQGTSSEEIVDVTNVSGTTWTITRGVDGSSGLSHSAGAKIVHVYTARDARESKTHQEATTGIHGLPPGDTFAAVQAAQTLANKTLPAPNISSPVITGGGSWAGAPSLASASLTDAELDDATLTNPTLLSPILNGATLNAPVIADLSAMQHDHGSTTKGGPIPQGSVTGLDARLGAIETKNTAQDGSITALQAADTALGARVTDLESGYALIQGGDVVFNFSGQDAAVSNVVFPTPFAAVPRVSTNINSGASETARWISRAISVTTSGFQVFVFSASGTTSSWTNRVVQWLAVDPNATP